MIGTMTSWNLKLVKTFFYSILIDCKNEQFSIIVEVWIILIDYSNLGFQVLAGDYVAAPRISLLLLDLPGLSAEGSLP